jgi:uncharacterized protein (TIGR03086 family)
VIDLGPATQRLTTVLSELADDDLQNPTPCPGQSVGDLVDHLSMFAVSFVGSARKETSGRSGPPPDPDGANLGSAWRDRVPVELAALAEAWRDPAAWEGTTFAGSIEMPADLVGLVALDELVVHGWDLAVATGQPYDAPPADVDGALSFVTSFEVVRDGSLFGPVVEVDPSASPLDRLLGLTGRDPGWRPPA